MQYRILEPRYVAICIAKSSILCVFRKTENENRDMRLDKKLGIPIRHAVFKEPYYF